MNPTARSKLAAETLRILDVGDYTAPGGRRVSIADSLKECLENRRCFVPDDLTRIRDRISSCSKAGGINATTFIVENETSLAGAWSLHQEGNNRRVGVLNFASARNQGGGFLGGSQAQEERVWNAVPVFTRVYCSARNTIIIIRQTRTCCIRIGR